MTAAPGPQQTDEARPVPEHCRVCNAYGWHVRNCPVAPSAQPDRLHAPGPGSSLTGYLPQCWCQEKDDVWPCPSAQPDTDRDLCSCGHGLLLHDGGEDCTMPTCPCTWFYEGRPDWDAQLDRADYFDYPQDARDQQEPSSPHLAQPDRITGQGAAR